MRPLSEAGRASSARLATAAAARGAIPDEVWHSGKIRARQTAECFWRACNPLARLVAARGLQPADPPHWIRDELAAETRSILLVGHMPHLARLLRMMCGDPADDTANDFPLHGCVALNRQGEAWKEIWRLRVEA